MPKLTPQEAAQKWANRTAAATPDVQRGVERTTRAPGAAAAAQGAKWHAKVTAARPKFERNVGAVSLQAWQAATIAGVGRIAAGVEAKKGKMEAFQVAFFAHLDRGKASIDNMPTASLEQSIAKMTAQVRHNAAFQRQPSS